jgi:hypothetical protein
LCTIRRMIDLSEIVEPEWLDWYRKTPQERLLATGEAWSNYLELGGSLEPDADSQSPFWSREELEEFARCSAATATRAFDRGSDD